MFGDRCTPGSITRKNLQDLSDQFQTSLTSTALRYVNHGPNICALVVSVNGRVLWFSKNKEFRFNIHDPRTAVHPLSGAGEFFNSGILNDKLVDVPVECWLDDSRIDNCWTIGELTFTLPRYETTVTILWPTPGSALDNYEEDDCRY